MSLGALTRRAFVGALAFAGARSVPASAQTRERDLADDVGAMLMLGFNGDSIASAEARSLAGHIAAGRVGAVVFRKLNVGTRGQVRDLITLFSPGGRKPIIAIDHEGGSVQRLVGLGFTRLPTALQVAARYEPEAARALYAGAAAEIAAAGFNLNLAPVVDIDNPRNPAVGRYGRAFDDGPEGVVAYAGAFLDGFAGAGVACALKHFPGEGAATEDSHVTVPDISDGWRADTDLEPFRRLVADGRAKVVMVGHCRLSAIDPSGTPASLSPPIVTGLLRESLGFAGVAMTDDLDMESLARTYGRREALIRAIAAGIDMPMICNTESPDSQLPEHAVEWIERAIAEGRLSRRAISEAAGRVRAYRAGSSADRFQAPARGQDRIF